MNRKISGYDVGALMYCPANSHKSIVQALRSEIYGKPFSLAFCLEDTVREDYVAQAEKELFDTLTQIKAAYTEGAFYLPLIFIRIRSPQHLKKLALMYSAFSDILTGFILPKFFIENCPLYVEAIHDITTIYGLSYYYMPIFESPTMIDLDSRYKNLSAVKAQLAPISQHILNIRVGGNDFSHAFGLRRHVSDTIYDVKPVANLLIDIVTTFATQYVVSGPVWEYYAGDGWDTGLRRELSLDLLSGFVGKTVIHPNQIPIVNEMCRVSKSDYADACSILNWDKKDSRLVCASAQANRMNEYNTHFNWANKIVRLAEIYGVTPN